MGIQVEIGSWGQNWPMLTLNRFTPLSGSASVLRWSWSPWTWVLQVLQRFWWWIWTMGWVNLAPGRWNGGEWSRWRRAYPLWLTAWSGLAMVKLCLLLGISPKVSLFFFPFSFLLSFVVNSDFSPWKKKYLIFVCHCIFWNIWTLVPEQEKKC